MAEQRIDGAESADHGQQPQTESNADRLRRALIECAGNLKAACRTLGLQQGEARALMRTHPDIGQLMKPDVDDVDALHRPDYIAIDPRSEAEVRQNQISDMVQLENNKLLRGLTAVGVRAPDAEIVLGYQYLAGRCFKDTVEAMHGGMVANYFHLMKEKQSRTGLADSIDDKLSDHGLYPPGSNERKALVEECKVLREQLREVDGMIVKCNEVLHRSALVMALQKSRDKGSTKEKKLGFDSQPVEV